MSPNICPKQMSMVISTFHPWNRDHTCPVASPQKSMQGWPYHQWTAPLHTLTCSQTTVMEISVLSPSFAMLLLALPWSFYCWAQAGDWPWPPLFLQSCRNMLWHCVKPHVSTSHSHFAVSTTASSEDEKQWLSVFWNLPRVVRLPTQTSQPYQPKGRKSGSDTARILLWLCVFFTSSSCWFCFSLDPAYLW